MIDRNIVTDLTQVGRAQVRDPALPHIFVTYNADFSVASSIQIDFTNINQAQQFGVIKSLFVDNGSNPKEIEISVTGTDQFFTVPAFASGVFSIDANSASKINMDTGGGATDVVTVTFYNFEKPPSVWYSFGAFNTDEIIKVEGALPELTDLDVSANNRPAYVGGKDPTGLLRGFAVDALGQIKIAGTVAVSGIIIADGDDAALGAKANAPVSNPASSGSLIALTKGTMFNQGQTSDTLAATPVGSFSVISLLKGIYNSLMPNGAATTGGLTSVASTIVDTALLVANANRKGMSIYNDGAANLHVALGNAVTLTSFTVKLAPNDYYELPFKYTGAVRGIWGAASGSARITELT